MPTLYNINTLFTDLLWVNQQMSRRCVYVTGSMKWPILPHP